MIRTGPPRAVPDTDIVFSCVLHEPMGRVAKRLGLLDLVWDDIAAETMAISETIC